MAKDGSVGRGGIALLVGLDPRVVDEGEDADVGEERERIEARAELIPSPETVRSAYDPAKEIIRTPNSRWRWASTNACVA